MDTSASSPNTLVGNTICGHCGAGTNRTVDCMYTERGHARNYPTRGHCSRALGKRRKGVPTQGRVGSRVKLRRGCPTQGRVALFTLKNSVAARETPLHGLAKAWPPGAQPNRCADGGPALACAYELNGVGEPLPLPGKGPRHTSRVCTRPRRTLKVHGTGAAPMPCAAARLRTTRESLSCGNIKFYLIPAQGHAPSGARACVVRATACGRCRRCMQHRIEAGTPRATQITASARGPPPVGRVMRPPCRVHAVRDLDQTRTGRDTLLRVVLEGQR